MGKEDTQAKQARLLQAIDYLQSNGKARTHQEIADVTGRRQPHVTSAIHGDPQRLTDGFLKRFAAAYSDYINAEYLIDGTGPMERPAKHTRPHIPTAVSAGFTDVAIASVPEADVEHHAVIDVFPSYDITIGVQGDSMTPLLADGDTIACRRLENISEIRINKTYVLDTLEGSLVKQIIAVADDAVTLKSLNPDPKYKQITIPSDAIKAIYQVVGVLHPLTL